MKEQDDILEYGYISGLIDSLEEMRKELAAAIKQRLQVGESGVAGPYIVTRREVHRFDISKAERLYLEIRFDVAMFKSWIRRE